MIAPIAAMLQPSGQGQSGGVLVMLWYLVGFGAIFYFLLIRPQRQQQKQHEEMVKGLKKGDEIVTAGGVVGEIVHIKDDRLTIRSGESKLVVERDRVTRVNTPKATDAAAS